MRRAVCLVRLLVTFASATCLGLSAAESPAIFGPLTLANAAHQMVSFHFALPPPGQDAVLMFHARMATPRAAGYTPALHLTLNGRTLDGSRLIGRPLKSQTADGRIHSLFAGERFAVFYAPDFTAADRSPYAIAGVQTGEFALRVTDLLRDGPNELVFANTAAPSVKPPLLVADGRITLVSSAMLTAPSANSGPPTGPLALCTPAAEHRVDYRVEEQSDARLLLQLDGQTFSVESDFSTPDGAWVHGSTTGFRHTREIERRAEAVVVFDSFENLTAENLPVMQRHRAHAEPGVQRVWLGGLSPATPTGTASDPQNPSVFGATARSGLGLLPLNDEFQVHVRQDAAAGVLTLADLNCVLRPGARYTAEWAIVPTTRPDYFAFVNAARRLLDANFTLRESFAFLRAGPLTEKWSDTQFTDFIRHKSAALVCASISSPGYQGINSHGTSFQRIPHDAYVRWVERVHRLAPDVQTSVYFHCFLDPIADSPTLFADARTLRPDGAQADYGRAVYKLFFPTETNTFGRAVAKNVDVILDEIRADGVYWDEFEYSAVTYHYGEPWDGCSADIDPRTHRITRLKSSVALLSQPWRVALAQKILARGPLVGNGQPHTRTVARLKFPPFRRDRQPEQLRPRPALLAHRPRRPTHRTHRGRRLPQHARRAQLRLPLPLV